MIPLDSHHWSELCDAYGSAIGIPALLRQLEVFPKSDTYKSEPWFSLWSALCHQGDVYSASFAAVPHIVEIAERSPVEAESSFLHLPACIEIARKKHSIDVPVALRESYFAAIGRLPALVAAMSGKEWDADYLKSALAAIAASKGYAEVAEAVQELDSETASRFMEWFFEQ